MSKTEIKSLLSEEIKYVKEEYKIEVKFIKELEKKEIDTIDQTIKNCIKNASPEVRAEFLKEREKEVMKVKREYEGQLSREEKKLSNRIESKFVDAIAEALKEDIDPQFLYAQILKYEFSPEQLLEKAIEVRTKEMREELKQVFRDKIIEIFDENPYLTLELVAATFEVTSNDEIETAPLIAEAYDEVKADFAAKYKDLINNATNFLSDADENKIIEYLNKQAHLNIILACSGKTQDDIVSEVNKALRRKHLNLLTKNLKQLNELKSKKQKIRNILGISAIVTLLLGLIFLLVFFMVTGVVLGVITFLFNKQVTKIKSEISNAEKTIQTAKENK